MCTGACVNTQTDNSNCGACGTACAGGQSCAAGACACPMGQIFCGGRCVNPLTDNANCGACGTACSGGQSCTNGTCACPGGGASCGGRCVNTNTETDHCGRCGNMCAAPLNSTATCAMGACGFTCTTGFGNCDTNPANGCETNLTNNGLHCGMCGNACAPPANAFSTCAAGRCSFGCLTNFADCDGNPANGCEANLLTSGTNCGVCGRTCGSGQVCGAGACMAICPTGSTLCSGVCVNTQADNNNCGACGQRCVAGANATAACTTGRCGITCNPGFADCNGNPVDGCEVNTQTTVGNCGRCGNVCPSGANSTATCAAGVCGVTCATGFGNCDNNATNGCEVNLQTTVANCGTCGRVCPAGANSTATCAAGTCGSTCNAGFGDCNGNANDGCETNLNTNVGNCGRCMNACVVPGGGTVVCTTGTCVQSCPSGQTACSNACVNTQLDRANCGRCGNACAAGQFCAAGACVTIAGPSFQVNSLTTTACNVIEHATPTGDDRGGIAVSTARVFYTGDSATGRFDLANLGTPTSVGRQYDALTSNLRDGTVYTLATGTTPLPFGGGTADGLVVIDGSTGALTTTRIACSAPIAMTSGAGIFAGYDRIVLYSGTRFYHVDLRAGSAGAVIDLGAFSFPTRAGCESWAFWGVAEFFAGSLYVDYVQSTTAIARTRVPDGATTVVNTFTNLSDMCSFTISTTNNRWYFHHEFTSQFRSGDETIGYCNATWTTDSPNVSLVTFPSASSQVGTVGFTGTLSAARAAGRRYFTTGDFVTETFTRTSAFSQLAVNFQIDDFTMGCAVGQALSWNVLVNGTVVGTFGFTGGSGVNPRTITQNYTFASQPAGNVVLRFQATSTVCSGGNSWIWVPGGTATLR